MPPHRFSSGSRSDNAMPPETIADVVMMLARLTPTAFIR